VRLFLGEGLTLSARSPVVAVAFAAVAACVAAPSAVAAAMGQVGPTAAAVKNQPRPAAGRWLLRTDSSWHSVKRGTMHITKNRRYVTSVHVVPTATYGARCAEPITVTGKFEIRPGYDNGRVWYIGKKGAVKDGLGSHKAYDVTLKVGSRTYPGKLGGGFSNKKRGSGGIQYKNPHIGCSYVWSMHKG
jgi:hypothetical protein